MAKKQTRRSISLSKVSYEALKVHCEAAGISMSQMVEIVLWEKLGLPKPIQKQPPVDVVRALEESTPKVRAPDPAPRNLGERIALQQRKIASKEAAEAAVRQREFEEASWRNPCRISGCRTLGLHPAHDDGVVSECAPTTDKTGGGDE